MENENKIKKQLLGKIAQLQRQVAESQEKYIRLSESILEGILIINFQGKILYGNESVAKMFGYKNAEEGLGKNVFNFVAPGYKKAALADLVKVFSGKWGFLAPYKVRNKDGNEFWIETLGRKITYKDKPAELMVCRDITDRMHMEEALKKAKETLEIKVEERTEELKNANEQLQRVLRETISALSSAVEAKDPYTAGHQQRVAQLACAIAKEMGLPKERIEGINLAAIVHDIGKIHVPAEILTKPGQLSDVELKMINAHPGFGYDILKSIEFPWPIADIVLQHHERIDGSGYPNGFSGKKILLEARIIIVADTVEAISTHRPYRAGLGINKALEEISANRGVLYDADAVEACLRLFKKKRFKLEQPKQ